MGEERYTKGSIQSFLANPDKYRNATKYSGISIRGNQLFKDGKQIIAHEDAPHTIDLEYKQNPVGRDKMYDLLSRKYIGISIHDVAAYLQSNETHQTHLPIRPRIKVAHPIISREPLKRLQMDLVDMDKLRPNDPNYHYTLNVLDLNSKRLWSRALTTKTGKSVAAALEEILNDIGGGKQPSVIQSDNGSEFISPEVKRLLESRNIKQVFSNSHNPQSQGGIERVQGTMLNRMSKYIALNNVRSWKDALQPVVDGINDTRHSTTNEIPNEVAYGIKNQQGEIDERRTNKIRNRATSGIVSNARQMIDSHYTHIAKLQQGDLVRVSLLTDNEQRKLDLQQQRKNAVVQNWSTEVYRIKKIQGGSYSDPVEKEGRFGEKYKLD